MSTKKKPIKEIEIELDNVESTQAENVEFNVETNADFSPFDEPVKERDYTSVKIDPKELVGELEEPVYQAPDMSEFELDDNVTEVEEEEPVKTEKKKKEPPHQFNESFSELSGKEKTAGAEMMVDVVLDGYAKLKKGIGSLATISEKKLDKEFAEGTISPDLQLPIDERGNTVGIRDFAKEFNEQGKEAFDTSQEFVDNVKPAMIRVFKKRGLGMTDEQLLAYHFGTDLVTSGITAFGLKKSADSILQQLREQTDILRSPNAQQPQPAQQPQQQAQPQQPSQQPQPKSEDVEESIKQATAESNKESDFSEPEEKIFEVQPDVLTPKKKSFDEDYVAPENMPNFGDVSILNEIEKIASATGEKPKPKKVTKGRGRPKKNTNK
jgi:hypothetical protein